MKLKYYLRGLGIGIVVSTLIMGIIFSNRNTTLSDEDVMIRAAQLGMVKSSTLTDAAETLDEAGTTDKTQDTTADDSQNAATATDATTSATEESATADDTGSGGTTDPATSPDTATDTDTSASTATVDSKTQTTPAVTTETTVTPTDTTAPVDTTTTTTTTTITISIVGGDSSVGVSNKLANAGLVDSATSFDKYLCANGYDKTLRVGTYQIPLGATEEEIAKIIAN